VGLAPNLEAPKISQFQLLRVEINFSICWKAAPLNAES